MFVYVNIWLFFNFFMFIFVIWVGYDSGCDWYVCGYEWMGYGWSD